MPPRQVWTIGHSNRTLAQLVELLRAHQIELVADVRRVPRSRRHPQFDRESLETALPSAGVRYAWFEALGGMRSPRPDSRHPALTDAFRGYADHMETREFATALERLLQLASARRVAYMCAEADWHDCHRRLLSDELKRRGVEVRRIRDATTCEPHDWPPELRIDEHGALHYRGAPSLFDP
jgi:uncharacterized protein (DUF488 family)